MIQCPDCEGTGIGSRHVTRHGVVDLKCERCTGLGSIKEPTPQHVIDLFRRMGWDNEEKIDVRLGCTTDPTDLEPT